MNITLCKNYTKYEYLLDPINIYCLRETIGIISVNLESKKSVILCFHCAIQMILALTN